MNKQYQTLIGLAAVTLVSACSSTDNSGAEIAKLQQQNQTEFNQCKNHVLNMDTSAKSNKSLAQYLTSATAGLGCLQSVQLDNPLVSDQQKMQLHALSILNFVKGGDVNKAQASLSSFTSSYRGKDLYFADNTSFVDTFSVLLHEKRSSSKGSSLNVNRNLMAELKRKNTWLNR